MLICCAYDSLARTRVQFSIHGTVSDLLIWYTSYEECLIMVFDLPLCDASMNFEVEDNSGKSSDIYYYPK